MKAAVLTKYDKKSPTIEIKELDLPTLAADEILVDVSVAGVNPLDNLIAHGELKLVTPYELPQVMGNEFVGVVKKVGQNVKALKVGDRVFGRMPLAKIGAFATHLTIEQSAVAKVPEYLTDEQAATVPLTALTAMQAFELLDAKPGQTLFISGGTGSFGMMAIPLAVARGLKVITSGSSKMEEQVKALGVTRFIDYRTEDYATTLHDIDLVIDTLGGKELEKQLKILKKGGSLVSLRGMPNKEFAKQMGFGFFKQLLFGLVGAKIDRLAKKEDKNYYFIFVKENGPQLAEAAEILSKMKIEPTVGPVYPLEQTSAALAQVAKGGNAGKVLIKN